MSAIRLSKNQKDVLFVLAALESNRHLGTVPLARVRDMIATSRDSVPDASNFRKGVHTLAERGSVELGRLKNLSLSIALTRSGRHQAAKIYRERTGVELDIKPLPEAQISIFE